MSDAQPGPEATPAGFIAPQGVDALRLQQLARVSAELGAADTMEDVVAAAVTHVAEAIGAAVTTLMVVDGDRLVLVAGHGLQAGVEQRWATFGLNDVNPASEAARSGRVVAIGDAALIEARYPVLRGQVPSGRSLVCLPLSGGPRPVGTIGLTFENGWLPGHLELDFLATFAQTCGQAVRRIRALEELRERAAQMAFLAEASAELASSLDYRLTLTNVSNLAVQTLADWCAVDILQDGVPVTLAVAHVDPAKVSWAWELQARYPTDPDSPTGSPNVIRTGVSELYAEVTDEMLVAAARDPEQLQLTRELHLRSVLIVPLSARGHTLGSITLIRTKAGRPYGATDLSVAEDLGRRAGVAIDNAGLFERTRNVALALQRAVLPDALDTIPPWEIATYYAPGGDAEVGGDFYDALGLRDGRLAFAIGDVTGHGVHAAAAMAQMRSAMRAYLATDPDPEVVVRKLDNMFDLLVITRLVTLIYGVIDPVNRLVSFVNAGHYPPLIATAGGEPFFAEAQAEPPVGTGRVTRTAHTRDFGPRSVMLLYTDGLIEQRGEIIDLGLSRLLSAAPNLLRDPLSAGLTELVSCVGLTGGRDDITAFAVRHRSGRK